MIRNIFIIWNTINSFVEIRWALFFLFDKVKLNEYIYMTPYRGYKHTSDIKGFPKHFYRYFLDALLLYKLTLLIIHFLYLHKFCRRNSNDYLCDPEIYNVSLTVLFRLIYRNSFIKIMQIIKLRIYLW